MEALYGEEAAPLIDISGRLWSWSSQHWGMDNELVEEVEDYVLQKATGNKDKNEKEIYEGDIIRGEEYHYDGKTDKMKSHGVWVGHVWYNDLSSDWVVSFNHLYSETATDFRALWQKEVIGNIFENENLLKENYR